MSSYCSPIVVSGDSCYLEAEGESKGEAIGARLGERRLDSGMNEIRDRKKKKGRWDIMEGC
jgi:hypothetical protein